MHTGRRQWVDILLLVVMDLLLQLTTVMDMLDIPLMRTMDTMGTGKISTKTTVRIPPSRSTKRTKSIRRTSTRYDDRVTKLTHKHKEYGSGSSGSDSD